MKDDAKPKKFDNIIICITLVIICLIGIGSIYFAPQCIEMMSSKSIPRLINLEIITPEENIDEIDYSFSNNILSMNGITGSGSLVRFDISMFDSEKQYMAKIKLLSGTLLGDLCMSTNYKDGTTYEEKLKPESDESIVYVILGYENELDSLGLKFLGVADNAQILIEIYELKSPRMSRMRLVKNRARFSDSFNYIAYSKVTPDSGEINTAEHYINCAKQDFTAIKGDIVPTSDGKIIMCHDKGITFDSKGHLTAYNPEAYIEIRKLHLEECLSFRHAELYDNISTKMTDFETYISICKKYEKIAYITIRDEYIDEILPVLFSILDKYKMRQNTIINSYTLSTLKKVREYDSDIYLSWVLAFNEVLSNTHVNIVDSLGNCLLCANHFRAGESNMEAIKESQSVLKYAKSKGISVYEAVVDDLVILNSLIDLGFDGAQVCVPIK